MWRAEPADRWILFLVELKKFIKMKSNAPGQV
jgi:hypothetical protein